jgi:putative ABC transport system permease protein
MTRFARHVRFSIRLLGKNPGFAAIAILALALGIGPNTAIFSVVYASLLAPLPYPHPDQLVMIWSSIKGSKDQVSAADFLDWKRQASSFQEMAAACGIELNLSSTQEPQYVEGERVSTNYYKLLGEKIWMGRDFRPDEDQPGKDHVFILSYRSWASKFGADPQAIGKQFRLNDEPYTLIGVLPPGPADRSGLDLWVPLRFSQPELARGNTWWYVTGRLKTGVSLQQAQLEMNTVAGRIGALYPDWNKGLGARVEPFRNSFLNPSSRTNLWLLLSAVGFVLLIACVNVANLLLARGVARQRELAVRTALGASRSQLYFQLLAESLTLAAAGGVVGTLLGVGMLKVILLIVPPGLLSPEADVHLSLPVLLFTLAITVFSGVLFGCAPALQARKVNPQEGLKRGGRSAVGAGHPLFRHALVVIEFVLALTLLSAAALLVHTFVNRTHVDLGVRTDHILTFYLPVPQSRLALATQTETFYSELLGKLQAVPGVRQVAASTDTPLDSANLEMPFSVVGKEALSRSLRNDAAFQVVTPGYFQTFGVRMKRGRVFGLRDTASAPKVAVVNEAFVHRFLGSADPLSQRLSIEQLRNGILALGPRAEWQIVGVFHDVQNGVRLGEAKSPQIFVPFAQSPWPQSTVSVLTAIEPEKMLKAVAAAVHSVDPNLPLANVKTMDQLVHENFTGDRFGMALYGSLAGIALVLASLGIYGVMSFTVAQSTAEIGLRMALGASSGDVLRRVLGRGLSIAGLGVVCGFIGTYFIGRAMESMLYGTGVLDWSAFSAVAALLFGAALLACYIPARRASAVDPIVALRQG